MVAAGLDESGMEPRSHAKLFIFGRAAGGQHGTLVAAGLDVNSMEPMSPAISFCRARGGQRPPTKKQDILRNALTHLPIKQLRHLIVVSISICCDCNKTTKF